MQEVRTGWESAVSRLPDQLQDALPAELFASLDDLLKKPPKEKDKRKMWELDVRAAGVQVATSLRARAGNMRQQLDKEIESLDAFKNALQKTQTIEVTVEGKTVFTCKIALKLD